MGLAALIAAAAVAVSPASFLAAHESGGAFAEPGGAPGPALTSWAVLGLRASGADARSSLAYLHAHEDELRTPTDVALVALAEQSLGARPEALLARLHPAANGSYGGTLNATFWAVLATDRASPTTVRFLLRNQARNGGWSWFVRAQPDSNDTAAALEALAVAHVRGKPVDRAVHYLRALQNRDGGFELTEGRGSDAQSTAWAIQGLLAAGRTPPPSAFRYLARLRRADGSYRYSARYATTPVWVTSQVLAALARKPFPL